jgi:hypothetical protein
MLHVAEQLAICYRRLGSMAKLPAQVTSGGAVKPKSNRTSADEPCAKYDDLRKPPLGEIGVKIDATGPWSDGFRGALSLWNTVLVASFHEETNLNACAIRVINGPDIVNNGVIARSQLIGRDGKIAVSPEAAKAMSRAEIYEPPYTNSVTCTVSNTIPAADRLCTFSCQRYRSSRQQRHFGPELSAQVSRYRRLNGFSNDPNSRDCRADAERTLKAGWLPKPDGKSLAE